MDMNVREEPKRFGFECVVYPYHDGENGHMEMVVEKYVNGFMPLAGGNRFYLMTNCVCVQKGTVNKFRDYINKSDEMVTEFAVTVWGKDNRPQETKYYYFHGQKALKSAP